MDTGALAVFGEAIAILDTARRLRSEELPALRSSDISLSRTESVVLSFSDEGVGVLEFLPPWRRVRDGTDCEEDDIEDAKLRCLDWLTRELWESRLPEPDTGFSQRLHLPRLTDALSVVDAEGGCDALSVLAAMASELTDPGDEHELADLNSGLAAIDARLSESADVLQMSRLRFLRDEVALAIAKLRVRGGARASDVAELTSGLTFDGARRHFAAFLRGR